MVLFEAFHLYWGLGGTYGIGSPAAIPKNDSLVNWIFDVIVDTMFVVGTIVPLALYQRWGRRLPQWMLAACCWIGAGILLLRGTAGLIDDGLRDAGLSRDGLTGLSYEQAIGVADPSVSLLFQLAEVDAYFALGGVLFLIAALTYHRSSRQDGVSPFAGPSAPFVRSDRAK